MEKQHFEILLESMDSKINLILEGYSVLDKRIVDEGEKRREENELLNVKISALSHRFDAVDSRLDGIDGRLDSIDGRLDSIHSELIDHRNNSEMHTAPRRSGLKKVA
jgi:hypothetical protein